MAKLWQRIVKQNPHLEVWDEWFRTVTMPGLDGVAVLDVYTFFSEEIKKNSLTIRSRAIAFSFFLAMFPALLFIFSLIPFILSIWNNSDIDTYIAGLVKSISPSPDVFTFLWGFISPLIQEFTHKRPSLLTGTFVLTLFLMSNGVVAMMSSFDKSYDNYKKRNAIMTRLVALKISLLLVALFIFSIVLVVMGQDLLEWVFKLLHIKDKFVQMLLTFLRYISIVLLFFFSISLIFYYGPATKEKYRFISTGSTVATILSILTSLGFSYYLNHYATYNKLYGPIGTVIALMIWLNLNAFVLIVGYEINAAIYHHHTLRRKKETPQAID
jgi:membrane protein